MIKPIGDSGNIVPLKKRQVSSKTDSVTTKSKIEDKVNISPEALSALKIDQFVAKVKELPAVREEQVAEAEQKIEQSGYLKTAIENISEQISSLFLGNEISS